MLPVLAPGAFLRTYIGNFGWGWIVVPPPLAAVDSGRGRVRIDARTRALVELCDGTRDLRALCDAATARTGAPMDEEEAWERLKPLLVAGALVDGAAGFSPEAPVGSGLSIVRLDAAAVARLAPVVLPGTGFDCDGRGGCCKLYDRVLLGPRDVANVRAAFGDGHTPGGLTVESAVRRDRDDQMDETYALAVVDGACVMLEADGACGVHRRLGAAAKPAGCRSFPVREVACGDELAVGVAVECRCAIDFAGGPPLAPLADALRAERVGPRGRTLEVVADEVPATLDRRWPRTRYVEWRRAAIERVAAGADPVAAVVAEAGRVLHDRPARLALAALRPLVDEVAHYLTSEAGDTAALYGPDDLQRRLFAWAEEGARRLQDGLDGAAPLVPAPGERFAIAQALHTHAVLRSPSLAAGLTALALRLLLARSLATVPDPPRELSPVSAVEYLYRAHALALLCDRRARDLEGALTPSI